MMFYVINFLSYLSPRKSSQTYTLSILAVAVDSDPYTERKNFKDMLLSAGKSGSRNPCRISGDRDYEWMQSAEASNIYVKIFTHRARVWVWVLVLGLGLDFGWVWVWV